MRHERNITQAADKTTEILNRICRIKRRAIYGEMTEAMHRAINRYWRAFHACAPVRPYFGA